MPKVFYFIVRNCNYCVPQYSNCVKNIHQRHMRTDRRTDARSIIFGPTVALRLPRIVFYVMLSRGKNRNHAVMSFACVRYDRLSQQQLSFL